MPTEKVLLTGISGFIGRHCALELLKAGYAVRGTLRDAAKSTEIETSLSNALGIKAEVEFFPLDLLSDAGWDEAAEGCAYVLHVASPLYMREPIDPEDLIKPAVEGTLRVLAAAERAGVKRVVLTSSSLSMAGDMTKGRIDASHWTDDASRSINSYTRSKTLAEKAAWKFVEAQSGDHKIELATVNPGPVYGPPIGDNFDGESMTFISKIMNGEMPMLPKTRSIVSDVRDVARVHVLAMENAAAAGKRFIVSTAESHSFVELAELLKSQGHGKVKTRAAPTFLLKFIALFDREIRGIVPLTGKDITADISQTKELLGWSPIAYEKTISDTAEALARV